MAQIGFYERTPRFALQYPLRRRGGVTLLELIIVLGLLVILGAISMPALTGTFEKQKLRSSAQQIQAVWNKTHIRAMKAGQVFIFRCEIGGTKYEVIPWEAELTADDPMAQQAATGSFGNAPSTDTSIHNDTASTTVTTGELPEGVRFVEGDTQAEERSMAIENAMLQQTSRNVQWTRPVLFYPDGLSSDAYLLLENKRNQGLRLTLRGMTGTSSLGDYEYTGGNSK